MLKQPATASGMAFLGCAACAARGLHKANRANRANGANGANGLLFFWVMRALRRGGQKRCLVSQQDIFLIYNL